MDAHFRLYSFEHGRIFTERNKSAQLDRHRHGDTVEIPRGIGGFVAGSWALTEYLRTFVRPRMFSGAIPPPIVAGLLRALAIVTDEPELRAKLWRNVTLMHERLREVGVDTGHSDSQIIPIMIGDEATAFAVTEDLFDQGVYINPIVYPAVAKNRSRLRMAVTAGHSEAEIEQGARIMISVLRKHGKCG